MNAAYMYQKTIWLKDISLWFITLAYLIKPNLFLDFSRSTMDMQLKYLKLAVSPPTIFEETPARLECDISCSRCHNRSVKFHLREWFEMEYTTLPRGTRDIYYASYITKSSKSQYFVGLLLLLRVLDYIIIYFCWRTISVEWWFLKTSKESEGLFLVFICNWFI